MKKIVLVGLVIFIFFSLQSVLAGREVKRICGSWKDLIVNGCGPGVSCRVDAEGNTTINRIDCQKTYGKEAKCDWVDVPGYPDKQGLCVNKNTGEPFPTPTLPHFGQTARFEQTECQVSSIYDPFKQIKIQQGEQGCIDNVIFRCNDPNYNDYEIVLNCESDHKTCQLDPEKNEYVCLAPPKVTATPVSKSPDFGLIPIPGITCGDANNPAINKCCPVSTAPTTEEELERYALGYIPDFGCLINVAGVKGFCISTLIKVPLRWVANIGSVKKILKLTRETPINPCLNGTPSPDPSDPNCICQPAKISSKLLCDVYLKNTEEYQSCVDCSNGGIWTGVGCVYTDLNRFIEKNVLGWGIGFGGGIALLCIIYAAFVLQTSRGNPEKVKKAQELLTSCIMGLLLIIFSVFILKLIGVDILKIPGFRK